jgi:uncharacterized protein (DUF1684 family)
MDRALELTDYRRRVAASYADVRNSEPSYATWTRWVSQRDSLFRDHPQSAIPTAQRDVFSGLPYFAYDPDLRITARLEPIEDAPHEIGHSGAGTTRFRPVGLVSLAGLGSHESLQVYWLEGYGGGLFLPFRDTTAGIETYGGGRYVIDSVKGADLGTENGDELVVDFNYAYHPSCVHSDRWSCPLAPPENRISARITAGERLRTD